jgi:hypothetical protein
MRPNNPTFAPRKRPLTLSGEFSTAAPELGDVLAAPPVWDWAGAVDLDPPSELAVAGAVDLAA